MTGQEALALELSAAVEELKETLFAILSDADDMFGVAPGNATAAHILKVVSLNRVLKGLAGFF